MSTHDAKTQQLNERLQFVNFDTAQREALKNALPTISGELNSGKFGATFPGTFSARTYLKVMARDCAQMLFRYAEPLAALAWCAGRPYDTARYEGWARLLLQNAVHDCIAAGEKTGDLGGKLNTIGYTKAVIARAVGG